MKTIPQYNFHKTKYGNELLIDVVSLHYIKKYSKNIPNHTLTYYDITFITEGSGLFRIDNKSYTVQPGDVIFSAPGEVRSWDMVNIHKGYALIFEEAFLLSFFNDPGFIRNLSYFHPNRETALLHLQDETGKHILELVYKIQQEILQYRSTEKHILRALLYEALALTDREYRQQDTGIVTDIRYSNYYIPLFTNLVDKYFASHHDTGFYADKLCLTSNYLNKLVIRTMGINAKRYIQNRIFTEAQRLLLYTDASVLEISESLSFETTSYFIRFFRKYTGTTPLQFRKENRLFKNHE